MSLKKSRLMIVSHSLSRTGAPKVALDIAYYYKNQYKVIVLSINANTPDKWVVIRDIKVHELPISFLSLSGKFLRLVNKVVSLLSLGSFDLKGLWYLYFAIKYRPSVVIHNTMYHSDLQRISNALNLKTVRYLHEDKYFLRSLSQHDIRVFNKGSITLGCSPSVIQASESVGINIYPKFLPAQTDNLIQIHAQSKEKITSIQSKVLSVGGDSFRKGADLAENIAESFKHDFEYHWYGFLESPDFIKIKYFGNVPNVPYSEYDVYAFTSRSDPWGIAVLEALASGLLIVGWDNLPLIVELNQYNLCYPVPAYDQTQFASTIENCQGTIQDMSTVESFLEKYRSSILYGKMLNQFI